MAQAPRQKNGSVGASTQLWSRAMRLHRYLNRSSLQHALLLTLSGSAFAACSPQDSAPAPAPASVSADDVGRGAPAVVARDAQGASTFLWAGRASSTMPIAGKPADIARAQLV